MRRQGVHADRSLIVVARKLRRGQTCAERRLWRFLRGRKYTDLKFRRQHQVDRYILDFFSPELRLAIELDGPGHLDPRARKNDERRTERLQEFGITVIRFRNEDFLFRSGKMFDDLEKLIDHLKKSSG